MPTAKRWSDFPLQGRKCVEMNYQGSCNIICHDKISSISKDTREKGGAEGEISIEAARVKEDKCCSSAADEK
jgi:hypothetical protein